VTENRFFGRLNKVLISAVVVALVAVVFPTASFAQLKVILSNGFGAAYRAVLPDFEKASGIKAMTIISRRKFFRTWVLPRS
jgi:hypothetical protein